MTHKELDTRDYDAILRARTNADGTPRPGYRRNVEAIQIKIHEQKRVEHTIDGGYAL